MFRPCHSTTEFPAPGLAKDAGAHLPFDFHRHPDFVDPPTCEHGTPRYSNFSHTAIAASRCCTPSPPASIRSNGSLSGSNYSYYQSSTSPFGSRSSFGSVPSIDNACNGQPSPDPSHRDSRAQSPVNKPLRSQPSRAGHRAQPPFHRHPTPANRVQSPVHRVLSPVLGHRSQTPAIGARGHAPRQPLARAREVTSSIDRSLQRQARRLSRPAEQSEPQDFVMADADASPRPHLAFGEQQAWDSPVFDQGDYSSQDSGGSGHDHHEMPHAQEPARHPFQNQR